MSENNCLWRDLPCLCGGDKPCENLAAERGETTSEVNRLLAESNAVRTMIREAINASCSCGGRGPHDDACPACMVWHRLIARGVVTP